MKTFLIQSIDKDEYFLPEFDFGFAVIQAVSYMNWLNWRDRAEQQYKYILVRESTNYKAFPRTYLNRDCIPVGSVEFCLNWFKQLGISSIKPLNIPETLWGICKRDVGINYLDAVDGVYMVKDIDIIKHEFNGKMNIKKGTMGHEREYFLSEWVDGVISEWRAFIYRGELVGIKNYSGNPFILPDVEYIDMIRRNYQNDAYTLDVMVYETVLQNPTRKALVTDIVELHEFFGCGLYGFDDYRKLLHMHIAATNDIIRRSFEGKL